MSLIRLFECSIFFLRKKFNPKSRRMKMASIPKQEYFDRIAKLQANMKKAGLDACLVHGTESDFANVRYLTEYWPTFEQAGVFVPAEGEAILLIGPESLKYAQGRSVVPDRKSVV